MGVEVALVEILALGDARDEIPNKSSDEHTFPQRVIDLEPHLVVEMMDLLHPLQVIAPRRGVGESPRSQIVHLRKQHPIVLERRLDILGAHSILEGCLTEGALKLAVVAASLLE